MIKRHIKLPLKHSFFLFGPRQTGKSTLLAETFGSGKVMSYDLLRTQDYHRLLQNPGLFSEEISARDPKISHVIIDEIQRVPELLNEVHHLMEAKNPPLFCLSGSSARKLKRAQANLLAGRAWTYHLYPLTHAELGKEFVLDKALAIGTLPSVYLAPGSAESSMTLKSYVETYLKEEIEAEALTRNIGGFLRFLHLAADENGNIINYSNIARECGVSYKTVQEYFRILEDTLVGFFLMPYAKSLRKRLIKHPKFYFFDTGVVRAIKQTLAVPLQRKSYEYGRLFEHFVIAEIMRLNAYAQKDLQFSFYRSSNNAEVDLIIQTPEGRMVACEIKVSEKPESEAWRGLKSFGEVCPKAELYCVCTAPRKRVVSGVTVIPWQDFFSVLNL